MENCVIGPVVAEIGGYSICALLRQLDMNPITFVRIGYCVFDASGDFVSTFADLDVAIDFVNDLIEADQVPKPK